MGRNNHSYTEEQIIEYSEIKKNICQNMRIARKLAKEPESLKRIEAPSSEIGPSLEVLCGAIELYEKDPNFYWVDWEENQKLLKDEKEEN